MLILTALFAAGSQPTAAASAENRAFDAVVMDFRAGFYERAEAGFANFAGVFTNSTRLAEAILYQAEARFMQANYRGAIELLSTRQGQAGQWTHEYLFWLAKACFEKGDYAAACDAFAKLIQQFPASPHCLEAAISQATACSKLGEWQRVVDLLQQTNGVFQTAARTNGAAKWTLRGYLLLGEALLTQRDYHAAEAALEPMAKQALSPQVNWERQYLLCRIQRDEGRTELALANTTNLLNLAASAAQRNLQAESTDFRAGLLERLGRVDEAIAAYTNNLAAGVPAEYCRQALLQVMKLSLGTNRLGQAIQMLETYYGQDPEAPAADLALLTLAELHLRQHLAGLETNGVAGAATNAPAARTGVSQAISRLQELMKKFPQSPLLGKARLDLGWCFWPNAPAAIDGNLPECQTNFQAAVEQLPFSAEQATAYFKLADAQFLQKNFAGAIGNYNAVVEKFTGLPEVKTNLFEPALYQIVQAGCAGGDLAAASNAMARIIAWFPNGFQAAPSVLLFGQEVGRRGNPALARKIFQDFVKAAPGASLLAEVQLAVARTYEQEGQWTNAVGQYSAWLASFTNSPARPQAEYHRAQAAFLAGDDTNALVLFTNFVAQFPANTNAPRAQLWVADYFFRTGNYRDAEINYQLLFQNTNWPTSKLTYEAQMMAGRAAFAQQLWNNAINDFTNLTSDLKCDTDLRVQAMFAYGDTLISQDSTNKLADYVEAVKVLSLIWESYPTNQPAVLALGRKADALLQLAEYPGQSENLTNALATYQQVIASERADVAARSRAKVGLAIVLEKQAVRQTGTNQTALLKLALNHCLDVLHGAILRDGETADSFWTKEAGLRAARLAEALQEWLQAVRVNEELQKRFPMLSSRVEKSRLRAQEQLDRQNN